MSSELSVYRAVRKIRTSGKKVLLDFLKAAEHGSDGILKRPVLQRNGTVLVLRRCAREVLSEGLVVDVACAEESQFWGELNDN